ncbi:MAG: Mpo1-like protein, partial [Pseudomonadota bacterium]
GHFFFEHNRPATFTYPLYSLIGDFRLFFDTLLRRVPG